MAQLSKLEELLSTGIGSKSTVKKEKVLTPHDVKPAFGSVLSPVSDNLFLAINGRLTQAHRAGLIDVMVVECLGFGKDVKSTPSGRFADQEYSVVSPTYDAIKNYAKQVRGPKSIAGTLVGTSILRPAFESSVAAALISYSFFSYGSRGAQDTITIGGKAFPRTQYNARLVKTTLHGLCRQLNSNTFKFPVPEGRKIRIGLPRILGGIGGILFADLLDLLASVTAEFPQYEFYMFSNAQPDAAVVLGVAPTKSWRNTNARGKKTPSKVLSK